MYYTYTTASRRRLCRLPPMWSDPYFALSRRQHFSDMPSINMKSARHFLLCQQALTFFTSNHAPSAYKNKLLLFLQILLP
jgi:hypothetical protein